MLELTNWKYRGILPTSWSKTFAELLCSDWHQRDASVPSSLVDEERSLGPPTCFRRSKSKKKVQTSNLICVAPCGMAGKAHAALGYRWASPGRSTFRAAYCLSLLRTRMFVWRSPKRLNFITDFRKSSTLAKLDPRYDLYRPQDWWEPWGC